MTLLMTAQAVRVQDRLVAVLDDIPAGAPGMIDHLKATADAVDALNRADRVSAILADTILDATAKVALAQAVLR